MIPVSNEEVFELLFQVEESTIGRINFFLNNCSLSVVTWLLLSPAWGDLFVRLPQRLHCWRVHEHGKCASGPIDASCFETLDDLIVGTDNLTADRTIERVSQRLNEVQHAPSVFKRDYA